MLFSHAIYIYLRKMLHGAVDETKTLIYFFREGSNLKDTKSKLNVLDFYAPLQN